MTYEHEQKKEAQNWIAESKKRGYDPAQIEEELKKQGYSTDLIKEALGDSKNNNMGSKNKTVITLAVLIILILGVGGYAVFTKLGVAENKYEKAQTLENEGKTDEALKVYQEVLTEYPNTKWACNSNNKLGRIYLKKMDYDMALQYFFVALEINKNSEKNCPVQTVANTNLNIGRIYFKKGDYNRSIAYLKEAYKLNPDSVYISYDLGEAYYLSGKYYAAKIYLKHSLRLNNTGEVASAAKKYLKEIQEKESA